MGTNYYARIMKEKTNIAELLKDCPSGMELECTICDNVFFDEVTPHMIRCYIKNDEVNNYPIYLHQDGSYLISDKAKCIIFPKGKTTWDGFHRPLKDGDILTKKNGAICIYKGPMYFNKQLTDFYCGYRISDRSFVIKSFNNHFGDISEYRFTTEEEKAKLFQAIKDNGYKWNAEAKTLENLIEPKFKVGDMIKHRLTGYVYRVLFIQSNAYSGGVYYHVGVTDKIEKSIDSKKQDSYELVPNKFDITDLKPFDKVLVRDNDTQKWTIDLFSFFDKSHPSPYICVGHYTNQCVPYKGNERLLGTTNDCDDYYKTWE